ncbi:hypothetical protein ETAA8_06600 [Anatilimnocola aggregata]|uniref:Uncharacterized protein n=1 Tax=Anatilimnocola aggregata TaxID=2528021 RepID=A0A517Y5V0_9BACT|nr:hypothetical protein [Anatilimnocola aggregata]QDU25590.1 hypothetical protein ETAA8_06600 [Anatilimnocola aggregata]
MSDYYIVYNGIKLLGTLTKIHDLTPIRDDSDTDQLHSKFVVSSECVVNIAVLTAQVKMHGVTGGNAAGANAASVLKAVRHMLSEDRKPFQLVMDGTIYLESSERLDANNGPKVRELKIAQVSPGSIKILFTVEVCRIECGKSTGPVNNRWTVTDDINEQWQVTRHWRGKLRVANGVDNPQNYRHLCVPVLARGFRRARMNFTTEPDGLCLGWEVTDVQLMGDAPPSGALVLSGNHTESMDMAGAFSIGNISVRLDGPPNADKQELLAKCMQIINGKIQVEKFNFENAFIFRELVITDHLGTSTVEARATVQRALSAASSASGSPLKLGNVVLDTFGKPIEMPNYDRTRMAAPPLHCASIIGLFKSQLQSACGGSHAVPQISDVSRDDTSPGEDDSDTEVTETTDTVPFEINSPGYSSEHESAMYLFSKVEAIYEYDEGYIFTPYSEALPDTGNTIAAIKVAGRTCRRIINLSVERVGKEPDLWEPKTYKDSHGITHYLKTFRPNFRPPQMTGDGKQIFTVDCQYVFVLSRAPTVSEFRAPALPWDTLPAISIPPSSFISPEGEKGIA